LYYRLSAHSLHLPPLRERTEDLPLLVQHFVQEVARELGRTAPTIAPEVYSHLARHTFPGNIRELQGLVADALTRHRGKTLSATHFSLLPGQSPSVPTEVPSQVSLAHANVMPQWLEVADPLPTLAQAEQFLINEALRRSQGNQTHAATLLGINRLALRRRLQS